MTLYGLDPRLRRVSGYRNRKLVDGVSNLDGTPPSPGFNPAVVNDTSQTGGSKAQAPPAFVDPNITPFPVTAPKIRLAPFTNTDPLESTRATGDFNRQQFSTDFDLALQDARTLASQEFDILNQFSQQYGPVRKAALAIDNQTNREELARSVDYGVPQARSFLAGQFDLANTLGQGRLPGSIDKAFEDSIRSAAADKVLFRGFGGDSVFGASVSDKLSAQERLGLMIQGSDLGTRALQQASSLYVDKPIKIDTTASFPQTPTVSPQQVAIGQRNARGDLTTINPSTALSADINQNEFRTGQEQGVNTGQASLDFSAETFNSGQAFSAQLTNKELELGNAIRAQDATQNGFNQISARADQATAANVQQGVISDRQQQAAVAGGVGAVVGAVLPLLTGSGGAAATQPGGGGGGGSSGGSSSGPLDFNAGPKLPEFNTDGLIGDFSGGGGGGSSVPSSSYGGTGAGGGGTGSGSPGVSISGGNDLVGPGGEFIPAPSDVGGDSGLRNDYTFDPGVTDTLNSSSQISRTAQPSTFPVVSSGAPTSAAQSGGTTAPTGIPGIATEGSSGPALPTSQEILSQGQRQARVEPTSIPSPSGGSTEVGGVTKVSHGGADYTVSDSGDWTRSNRDGTITDSSGSTTRQDGRLIAGPSSTRTQAVRLGKVGPAVGMATDPRDRLSPVRAAGNGSLAPVKNLLQGEWDFARTFPAITPQTAGPIRTLQTSYKAMREGQDTPSFVKAIQVPEADVARVSAVIDSPDPKASAMHGVWSDMTRRAGYSLSSGDPVSDLRMSSDVKMGTSEFGELEQTRGWMESSLKSSGILHGKTIVDRGSVLAAADAVKQLAKKPDAGPEERSALHTIAVDGIVHGYGLRNPQQRRLPVEMIAKDLTAAGPNGRAALNLVRGISQPQVNERQLAESSYSIIQRFGKTEGFSPDTRNGVGEASIAHPNDPTLKDVLGLGGGLLNASQWDRLDTKARTRVVATGVQAAATALISTGNPAMVTAGQHLMTTGAVVFPAVFGALQAQQGATALQGAGSSVGQRALGGAQVALGGTTVANAGATAAGSPLVSAANLKGAGQGVAVGAAAYRGYGVVKNSNALSPSQLKAATVAGAVLAPDAATGTLAAVGTPAIISDVYHSLKNFGNLTAQQGAISGASMGAAVGTYGGPVGMAVGMGVGAVAGAGLAQFGGGKGKAQQDRDVFRGAMQQSGVYNKDGHVVLADGTTFNPANAKSLPWFDKSKTAGNPFAKDTRQSFDVDYTSDLDMSTAIGGLTLSRLLIGSESTGDGRHYDQLGGEMTNAAVSNLPNREFTQENFAKAMSNMRANYLKSGIASADQVKQLAGDALKAGKMNQFEYDQALQAGSLVFGNDFKTATQLMQGRWE